MPFSRSSWLSAPLACCVILFLSGVAAAGRISTTYPGNVKMNRQVWLHWKDHVRDRERNPVAARPFIVDFSKMLVDSEGTALPNQDQIKKNIEFALKEWTKFTAAPVSGGDNVNETGQPSMASGPRHGNTLGKTFRAMGQEEKNALADRYMMDSVGFREPLPGETPDVRLFWDTTVPGQRPICPADAIGCAPASQAPGNVQVHESIWGVRSNLSVKTQSIVVLRAPNSVFWQLGGRKKTVDQQNPYAFVDTSGLNLGNDYVKNSTPGRPNANQYDFYSVLKHEIGHVMSFKHDGGEFLKSLDSHDHSWVRPTRIDIDLDTTPARISQETGVFSRQASRFYISAELDGGFGGKDLWVVDFDLETETWAPPVNLGPDINSPFDETDPYLADNFATILFASNRPGGAGGYDLFQANQSVFDFSWQISPMDGLNSSQDERSPNYSIGQEHLFFSSNRDGGMGGFDVYSSRFELEEPGDGFLPPENLGSQINSAFNEVDPAISTYDQALYFASDRPGGEGGMDIYQSLVDGLFQFSDALVLSDVSSPWNDFSPSFGVDDDFLYFVSDREGSHAIYHSENVPEPAAIPLAGVALFALIGSRRRDSQPLRYDRADRCWATG